MDFSQGYGVAWALMGLLSLLLVVIIYRVLRNQITLKTLARAVGRGDFFPKVEIQKEGSLVLINLALVNSSDNDVWVEHCVISLSDFKGIPSHGFEAWKKRVSASPVGSRSTITTGHIAESKITLRTRPSWLSQPY